MPRQNGLAVGIFSDGPFIDYNTEITAVGYLKDTKLAVIALKGDQILIKEIASRGRIISSLSWNKSIIWGIYEHANSKNFKRRHNCFYIVHSDGVSLLEHDGRYNDLKITQNSLFADINLNKNVVERVASNADFDHAKIWSYYSGFKYNYLLVIKDDKLFRYNISDSDDKYLHQRVFYDTHSAFIQVKVVKTHNCPTKFESFVYVGLSNG